MIKVNGTAIEIIRGDSEPIDIEFIENEVEDGTVVIFLVRKGETEYIRKEMTVEDNKITPWIMHADTAEMALGTYEWGLYFPDYRGEGEPYHIDTPWRFNVVRGV